MLQRLRARAFTIDQAQPFTEGVSQGLTLHLANAHNFLCTIRSPPLHSRPRGEGERERERGRERGGEGGEREDGGREGEGDNSYLLFHELLKSTFSSQDIFF